MADEQAPVLVDEPADKVRRFTLNRPTSAMP